MQGAADLPGSVTQLLAELCDGVRVPITFADPQVADTPLVYVNPAFEEMSGWRAQAIIGRNCRFLQGPETDRTITDEMAHACAKGRSDVFTLLNYRRDGTPFVNVVGLRTIHVSTTRNLIMGCQMEYRPLHVKTDLARHVEAIASVIHLLHGGRPFDKSEVSDHDMLRLDTLRMRFETAFVQTQNRLILGSWRAQRSAEAARSDGDGARKELIGAVEAATRDSARGGR